MQPLNSPSAPGPGIQPAHRSVVVLLLLCGAGIALGGVGTGAGTSHRGVTIGALILAAAGIVLRRFARSSTRGPTARHALALASLACHGALGILGLGVAYLEASPRTGLALVLAGLIFSIHPPVATAPR